MSDFRLPKARRLLATREFERVYRDRCRASDAQVLIYAAANNLPHSRVGLSVSRKVGEAVVRNRWKRLFREAFRLSRERMPTGIDFVLIPKPESRPTLAGLRRSLETLSHRLARRCRNAPQ